LYFFPDPQKQGSFLFIFFKEVNGILASFVFSKFSIGF